MADQILTPPELSRELLKQTFEDAYMSVSLDDEGDIKLKETFSCFVLLTKNNTCIHFLAFFRAREEASLAARLKLCNSINDGLMMLRAAVTEKGGLCFDYHMWTEGGVTKRNIIMTAKAFHRVLADIGDFDKEDVLE